MASSRSDRVYHQDYIARIRYSNTLPPPPNPPKLLDIPNTGLVNGHYTSAAFASRLAREQPLNIEADAELGMPINLIGMPGVFDGDESAIYALDNPPLPHPHDKPLLRPLSMLGKAGSMISGVSFLRRTEYISSDQGQARFESTKNRDIRLKQELKRKRTVFEKDNDPTRILRAVIKGFDTAYPQDASAGPEPRGAPVPPADAAAWDKPRHPTNPDLQVLDTYPILPDFSSATDSGAYVVLRFLTNPALNVDIYEPRLDVGLLRPLDLAPEAVAQYELLRTAHEADPTQPAPGPPRFEYEYFLPQEGSMSAAIKDDFRVPHRTSSSADAETKDTPIPSFRYARIRAYETYQQTGDRADSYGDAVALALHDADNDDGNGEGDGEGDGERARLQTAAYYYPILQRTYIRPRRRDLAGMGGAMPLPPALEENRVDYLEVAVREQDEGEIAQRVQFAAAFGGEVIAGA